MLTSAALKLILPLACSWAEEQERMILGEGVPLTPSLMADAVRIGVREPERVRMLAVDKVPLPLHPLLRAAAEKTGLISGNTAGMSLRYGIFVRADHWGERRLVVHELAHTVQYERLGGFPQFLEPYLRECMTPPGYPFGPLEQEAKQVERDFCS